MVIGSGTNTRGDADTWGFGLVTRLSRQSWGDFFLARRFVMNESKSVKVAAKKILD